MIIGLFVGFYDSLRDLAPSRVGFAVANARGILAVERFLHIDVEHSLNLWLAGHHSLGLAAGDWYDVAHFFITFPLLGYVWWRAAPATYRYLRNVFVLVCVLGFLIYLVVPLAPPRLVPGLGFTDVVATTHAIGGWSTVLSHASDLYASMPSLHIGWALWCTVAVFTLTRRRLLRSLAVVYPMVTTVVILATGNHWVIDAIAGALCLVLSVLGARLISGGTSATAPPLDAAADDYPAPSAGHRNVLIVSASMGAGHDGAANELARRLELTGHGVTIRDYLPAVPFRMGYFIRWFYAMQLKHAPRSYDWHYSKMRSNRAVMWVTVWFASLAKRRVLRMVRLADADVVVSTYPLASQALGRLRALGRLPVPWVTFVTDFSVHPAIVSRYVDLNLCITAAAAEESRRLCGRPSVATGPLVPEWFRETDNAERRAAVRAELGMPDGVVALVVAGSWGVGNVQATVDRLAASAITPFVMCGHNEALRAELAARPGVIAVGWRADMPRILRACDVVVENAGGLTAMEAMAAGVPVISHETIPGHGRHNASEMHEAGVTGWVRDPQDLVATVWEVTRGQRGELQRAAGRSIFVADPAVIVAELARCGDIGRALATADIAAPSQIESASASRLLRTRRRVLGLATAMVSLFYLGTAGVAVATDHGLGVADARSHPHDVYVVVNLTTADLTASGLVKDLKAVQGTAVVEQTVLNSAPSSVWTLAADGIDVASSGVNYRGWAVPNRSYKELTSEPRELAAVTDTRQWLFVWEDRVSVVDLCSALLAKERIVTPNSIVNAGQQLPHLRGGTVVLVDGRDASAGQLEATLALLKAEAASERLRLHPLLQIAPEPT